MSTSLPDSNSHARFQNTLHDMHELAKVAKTSYASLADMLPCCPTNEQGTKRKLCVSLSLDTSVPSHRLTAHVQGVVVNSDGAHHVCWQFEHGPMTLEENDTVQVLRLPRVTATGPQVELALSSATSTSIQTASLDDNMAETPCAANLCLHEMDSYRGVVARMLGHSIIFPLAVSPCDAAVQTAFLVNGNTQCEDARISAMHAQQDLLRHTSRLMRFNYASIALPSRQTRQTPAEASTPTPDEAARVCEALDSKLAAFQARFTNLDTAARALHPATAMADVLALFELPGMTLRPRRCACDGGPNALPDGVQQVMARIDHLTAAAKQLDEACADLRSAQLPSRLTGFRHLIRAHPEEAQKDMTARLHTLLELRQQQCAAINALRPRRRLVSGVKENLPGKSWNGGSYPAMVDVRAHYIGLSAIEDALMRLACSAMGAANSTALLPAAVHTRHLQQVWARNQHNTILLSRKAYEHNMSLVQQTADVAPMPLAKSIADSAVASVTAAALLSLNAGQQLAHGVFAGTLQTKDIASGVPTSDILESINPAEGRQHYALCQMHALVNSDLLNRIITPLLHRRIFSALEHAATQLSMPARVACQETHEIFGLFAAEVQPLAHLALSGRAPQHCGDPLAFLHNAAPGTGYDNAGCLHCIACAFVEQGGPPSGSASASVSSASVGNQLTISKSRQEPRRSVSWRVPLHV